MNKTACIDILEVFKTNCGTVSQCNKTNTYILEFQGNSTVFKATDFIDFIKRVNQIDIDEMICSSLPVTDVTLLMPPYCKRCFVLTLSDVLSLRHLLNGARFTLHLNSVLWECLRPVYL